MTIPTRLRRKAAAWTYKNPVLLQGEPGLETDTGLIKVGNGSTAWASLGYTAGPVIDLLTLADDAAARTAISAQASDSDLTDIAGLSPANDDFVQRKSGVWANRTVAQVKDDLVVDADPIPGSLATVPRFSSSSTLSLTSGVMHLAYKRATQSITAANMIMCTGSTAAAATPTLGRMGIYSVAVNGDLTLIASTANDTSLFSASQTAYNKALSSPIALTHGSWYAFGVLVVSAVTMPSISGTSFRSSELALSPVRLSASLLGQTDLPTTVTSASLSSTTLMAYIRAAA